MSNMKPVAARMSRPLGFDPWALRRPGMDDPRKFVAAMAVGDPKRAAGPEYRIEVQRTHYTSTGARYRVTYLGETLVESARDPEFEACRALFARGIVGTLVTYSPGSLVPRMKIDIEKGAKLSTIDNANEGPRFGRYRPHPGGGKGDDAE
jgi:hypothetical protein